MFQIRKFTAFIVVLIGLSFSMQQGFCANVLEDTKPWDFPYIGTLLIPENMQVTDVKASFSNDSAQEDPYHAYQLLSSSSGTYHTSWLILYQGNNTTIANLGPLFASPLPPQQRLVFAEAMGKVMIGEMNRLSEKQEKENFQLLGSYPLEYTKFSNQAALSCGYQIMLNSDGFSIPLYAKVFFLYNSKLTMLALMTFDSDKTYWNDTLSQMLSRQLTDS